MSKMALQLYGHPFSSYTWKALIALYEEGIAFEFRMIDADSPGNGGRLKMLGRSTNSLCWRTAMMY